MATTIDDTLYQRLNAGLNAQSETARKSTGLDQNAFLTMMIAQMKNQDPTKPMDAGEYLGQLAQFSTVTGIQELQQTVKDLTQSLQTSQAITGSELVGRYVRVSGDTGYLGSNTALNAVAHLDRNASGLTAQVLDASGRAVRTLALGTQAAGDLGVAWDGKDDAGVAQAPGTYRLRVEGSVDGKRMSFGTSVLLPVTSISRGDATTGMTANLAGGGSVAVDAIEQIY